MNIVEIPLVSICCLTYNHEEFITQTLEGFLMQKTDFAFEILVHDDASNDNTPNIINEYSIKYPKLFRPILQLENQYSKGVNINATIQFTRANGIYIAICEGDDYWTDPLKLQKQVDFLNNNNDVSLCFHNCAVIFEKDAIHDRGLKIIEKNRKYNASEILKHWVIPTASVMFRKDLLSEEYRIRASNKKFMYGDIILFLSMAERGDLYGLTDFMSTYRRHTGGVTNVSLTIKHYERRVEHLEELIKVFGLKYREALSDLISFSYANLFVLNLQSGKIKGLKRIISKDKLSLIRLLKSELLRSFKK